MKLERTTLRVKENLARLLAKENITVLFSASVSAKFDLERRILFCPLLDGIDSTIANLIIGHETGHALYTKPSDLTLVIEDPKYLIVPATVKRHKSLSKDIWNAIEDARIERKIVEAYPGMREIFSEGYRRLFSKEFDFFKVHAKNTNVNTLTTVDKLNLLAKVGPFSTVTLDQVETGFFDRMMTVETIDEIVALGREIWDYMQQQNQQQKQQQEKNKSDTGKPEKGKSGQNDNGDVSESDTEEDSQEQSEPSDTPSDADPREETETEQAEGETEEKEPVKGKSENSTEAPEGVGQTQNDFDNSLKETFKSHEKTDIRYFEVPKVINAEKAVITWETILHDIKKYQLVAQNDFEKNLYTGFFKDNSKVISEMLAMFNMRRNASNIAKQSFAKTGVLNMDSLTMHKFTDDIFKRVAILPRQQNHGLSVLVDWSGSMDSQLTQTIEQLLILAIFCRRAKIPYNIYLFSDQRYKLFGSKADPMLFDEFEKNLRYQMAPDGAHQVDSYKDMKTTVRRFEMSPMNLVNVLSSEMNDKTFNTVANFLLNMAVNRKHRYFSGSSDGSYSMWNYIPTKMNYFSLGSTPMLTALVFNSYLIQDMKKKYRLDKMHQVLITDGAPTDHISNYIPKSTDAYLFLIDGETKKPYRFFPGQYSEFYEDYTKNAMAQKNVAASATMAFAQISKERTGVSNFGYYITAAQLNEEMDINASLSLNLNHSDLMFDLLRSYTETDEVSIKALGPEKALKSIIMDKRYLVFSNNIFDKFYVVAQVTTDEGHQKKIMEKKIEEAAKRSERKRLNVISSKFQALMKSRELKKIYSLDLIKVFA